MSMPQIIDLTQNSPRRSLRKQQRKPAQADPPTTLSRPSLSTARPESSAGFKKGSISDIIDLTRDNSPPSKSKKRKASSRQSTQSPNKKKKSQNASYGDCAGAVEKSPEKRLRT